jgi:hypothetical protein
MKSGAPIEFSELGPNGQTPQVIEMSSDSKTDRRSLIIFALAIALTTSWLTGWSAKNAPADERFLGAEARRSSAKDQSFNEPAVLHRVKAVYSGTSRLTDPQQKELLEAACQANDIWDLSQDSSKDDATKWVAGKSNVPAEKVRGLLNQLGELQLHPGLTPGGLLAVNAVCPAW